MNNKVTYRQQFTRCGKQRCRKCKEGAGHGPYWYAYWSENGRTISKYVGIHLPADVALAADEAKLQQLLPSIALAENESHQSAIAHDLHANAANSEAAPVTMVATPVAARRSTSHSVTDMPGTYPTLRIYLLGQFRIERRNGNKWQKIIN